MMLTGSAIAHPCIEFENIEISAKITTLISPETTFLYLNSSSDIDINFYPTTKYKETHLHLRMRTTMHSKVSLAGFFC